MSDLQITTMLNFFNKAFKCLPGELTQLNELSNPELSMEILKEM